MWALNRVHNKREIFEVRSPMKILSTPCSGIWQYLTLIRYSRGLTYVTRSRSIYSCINISITTIGWPTLYLRCLVLAADMKSVLFWWSSVIIYWFIILERINVLWRKIDWEEIFWKISVYNEYLYKITSLTHKYNKNNSR